MKYKKGDVFVCGAGEIKVLAIIDDLYAMSHFDDFDSANILWTQKDIEKAGLTLKKEKTPKDWVPKEGEKYWFLNQGLRPCSDSYYNSIAEAVRKDGLGIYKTSEEAEEVAEKIKQFIKTL